MLFDRPRISIVREAESDESPGSTDYTANDDDTLNTDSTDDGVTGSADYTSDEVEIEPDGPSEDESEDEGGTDDAESVDSDTDYTSDTDGEEDGPSDDMSGEGGEEQLQEPEEDQNTLRNNRILLDDTTSLYYTIREVKEKLSEVNMDNILISRVINQVVQNLTKLEDVIFEFIVFQFSKNKYVNNLYKYDYFIKAFKTNIEMLKKIKVLVPNK